MIKIRKAVPADTGIIRQIADEVWWPTYIPVIGEKQVAYMLGLFYNTDIIQQQLTDGSQTYLLLENNDEAVGFAAYSPRAENPAIYKLHKLYCLTNMHGKGYGRMLLQAVEAESRSEGAYRLELNVNRYNPAKAFYEKMGYTVSYEEDIDIGSGYWMNDYVMGKDL
jgi:GNAT superfamily N-acetyltransferase